MLPRTILSDDDLGLDGDAERDDDFEVAFDDKFEVHQEKLDINSAARKKIRELVADDDATMKKRSLTQKVQRLMNRKGIATNKKEKVAVADPATSSGTGLKSLGTKTWESLGLIKPLLRAVADLGYLNPTLIQELTIPVVTTGRDVLASSITGSGKTAAFLLPVIQSIYKIKYNNALGTYTKCLVVLPTRELALQCYEMFAKLNKYTQLSHALVIGKVALQKQEAEVRRGPDVIIATPGRIVDLIKNSKSFNLDNLETLIFDEADKLLSMGFKAEVEEIIDGVPKARQTLLFSATLDDDVKTLIKLTLIKPLRIQANPDKRVSALLKQEVILVSSYKDRESAIVHLVDNQIKERCIIFFKTKAACHSTAVILSILGKKVCELHGNMSQIDRVQAFEDFRDMKFDIMLATDLAARGLDIKNLNYVVNFELPRELTRYIHRVGRTARAGEAGTCLTLVTKPELKQLKTMVKSTGDKLIGKRITHEEMAAARMRVVSAIPDHKRILEDEKVEKEFEMATMEANKAENMLRYREDIYSKPRREWVVSEKFKEHIRSETNPNNARPKEVPEREERPRSFGKPQRSDNPDWIDRNKNRGAKKGHGLSKRGPSVKTAGGSRQGKFKKSK